MPQYMLILGGTDKQKALASRELTIKKYAEWTDRLVKEKRFKDAHKLKDGQGRRLKSKDDQVVDGPFSETKETVGGYYIIEAGSYDEAAQLAKDCPVMIYQGGYVEIREIER